MFWLAFPAIASIFYCISAYVQNYITDNEMPKKRAGAYAIMRMPGYIFALIILLLICGQGVFMIPLGNAVGIMIAGAVNVIGHAYYYRALQSGDTADITIFGQVSPIISLGLGVAILGESISGNQGIGFIFIMAATCLVIFGGDGGAKKKQKFDIATASLTIFSSFFSVLSDILFAYFLVGTKDYTLFAQSFFYFELGCLVFTILICIFFKTWRKAVRTTFFTGRKHRFNLATALADNMIFVLGDALYKLALITAPVVALVSVIGKVAALFSSLFMTVFFGRVFPKFISAKMPSKKMLMRYLIASIVIIAGVLMVNS